MEIIETRQENIHNKLEKRRLLVKKAKALREDGYSNLAIGEKLGISESSVRSLIGIGGMY